MSTLRDTQLAFAAHLRDPQACPAPPGLDARRVGIYRDLLFNNIGSFVAGFFPVLRTLYTDAAWQALVRDFYARHRSRTPYFLEIAEEFLQYLQQERVPGADDPPFAAELAHYEWLELVVDVATDDYPRSGVDPAGDLMAGVPRLNPVVAVGAYHWPVHRIDAGHRPQAPSAVPVFLVVWRDRDDQVRFMEANAATARLIDLMRAGPALTGLELARQVATELQHPRPEAVIEAAAGILAGLRERDIVAGTRSG